MLCVLVVLLVLNASDLLARHLGHNLLYRLTNLLHDLFASISSGPLPIPMISVSVAEDWGTWHLNFFALSLLIASDLLPDNDGLGGAGLLGHQGALGHGDHLLLLGTGGRSVIGVNKPVSVSSGRHSTGYVENGKQGGKNLDHI